MSDPRSDTEPATEQQMERLRRLGLHIERPIGRELADTLIEYQGATPRQLDCLEKFGMKPDGPIRRFDARQLIGREIENRRRQPATHRQETFLRLRGEWRDGMTMGEAYDRIAQIKGTGD